MWHLLALCLVASATAQIPSLGWCPDYKPMDSFSMKDFLGDWYEAERYFTVSELGTRCVKTNYATTPEGRVLVSNEITNSLTGVKRLLEGSLQLIGREGEGRVIVKYSTLPIPYDTEFSILGTDYNNYAVMWACSGIGPVHTQNAWVLTRNRLPSSAVLQAAYGILDDYKISRTFFVRVNQADCDILPSPVDSQKSRSQGGAKIEDVVEKKAGAEKIDEPVEQKVQEVKAEVKAEIPQERVAVVSPDSEVKAPLPLPELILEAAAKKDEPEIKPAEEPLKVDMKIDIVEPAVVKEKEEKPAL